MSSDPRSLAAAKLAESGLDLDDAQQLGIDVLDAPAVQAIFDHPVPALRFAYHTLDGQLRDDLYRLRVLGAPPPGPFGEVAQLPRYWQPPGSPVGVYYPRNGPRPWAEVAADASVPLVITEGELKAAAACKVGIQTLALGGVWSWCNRKLGVTFLTDLERFVWGHREVVLCFDSDAAKNHHVAQATAAFVRVLRDRGAAIQVAQLPELEPHVKCGLDDYLVARGPEALRAILNEASPLDDLTVKLLEFNARFIYIVNPGKVVYDTADERLVSTEAFVENHSNVQAQKALPGPAGIKYKTVDVAREWIKWPARRTFFELTYAPGKPRLLNGVPDRYRVNRWRGWPVEPVAGDVSLWTQLLDHLFAGADPVHGERRWFESWLAYPIQHPGVKMTHASGLWSTSTGQGKSLIGVAMGFVYGSNYGMITEDDLEGSFNSWAECRQFIMVDDMTAHDSRRKADILKTKITQRTMRVNIKYVPQFEVPDCINYYMNSNRPNAFYIDPTDRRMFVYEVKSERLPQPFYDRFFAWLERGPGAAALLHHFQTLDLGDFSPYTPPPLTPDKQQMIDATRSDPDLWTKQLLVDPDGHLRLGTLALTRDLFTSKELLTFYCNDTNARQPSHVAFGSILRTKFKQANDGKPVRIDGRLERLWIVRHPEKWLKAKPDALVEHVANSRAVEKTGGKF